MEAELEELESKAWTCTLSAVFRFRVHKVSSEAYHVHRNWQFSPLTCNVYTMKFMIGFDCLCGRCMQARRWALT